MKWMNVELSKEDSDLLKGYLKANGIRYEASEADNLIHFEIYADSEWERMINQFLHWFDE